MTRKDDAEILRGEKIKAVMTEFATELIDNEELIASNAEYDAEIAAADACKDKQVENIKGNAEKKKAFRTISSKQGFVIAGVVYVFANKTGDTVLAAKMKLVISDFDIKDKLCLSLLNQIKNVANLNKSVLLKYGLTPTLLGDFAINIKGYEDNLLAPILAIGDRHDDTLELEAHLIRARYILINEIEKLMAPYEFSNISFFNKFNSADQEIILGSHKKRLANVVYGFFRVEIRNNTTKDLISGLAKVVNDEMVYPCPITGSKVIESEMGEQTLKVTAIDYQAASEVITVVKAEQLIVVYLEPV